MRSRLHSRAAIACLGIAAAPVGSLPQDVAADPQTNMVYVADTGSSSVAVLAGAG